MDYEDMLKQASAYAVAHGKNETGVVDFGSDDEGNWNLEYKGWKVISDGRTGNIVIEDDAEDDLSIEDLALIFQRLIEEQRNAVVGMMVGLFTGQISSALLEDGIEKP